MKKLELGKKYEAHELPKGINNSHRVSKYREKECSQCGGKITLKWANAYGEDEDYPTFSGFGTPVITTFSNEVDGVCRKCYNKE